MMCGASLARSGAYRQEFAARSSMEVPRIGKEVDGAGAVEQKGQRRADDDSFGKAGAVTSYAEDDRWDDIDQLCQADGNERNTHTQGRQRNLNQMQQEQQPQAEQPIGNDWLFGW